MTTTRLLPSASACRCKRWYVYIVQCRDGTYYTGATTHLERRVKLHNAGKGAKYVRGRGPVTLVYAKAHRSYPQALRAERQLKQLARKQKEDVISWSSSKRMGGRMSRWLGMALELLKKS